MIPPSK